ncbi:MAG: lipoate--protein ligase family protein [Planctomycetota bacterium]
MRLHDLTLPTPALNLALDEALLLDAEGGEVLRLWEAPKPFVVLGRSSRRNEEADIDACEAAGMPIYRRVSGGASIVTGPGCLMYAVVLDLRRSPELADLTAAHRHVLGKMVEALQPIDTGVSDAGTSDLVVSRGGELRKFSGNSVRRVRDRLLYHGTLLYDFDLSLIGGLLRTAPRQPDYRQQRDHQEFVANLNATREEITRQLVAAWSALEAPIATEVLAAADRLVAEKYDLDSWNAAR